MPTTFSSWTTSDDASNPVIPWGSEAEIVGWPSYIHAECVRQALAERLYCLGYNVPDISTPLLPNQPVTKLWKDTFQSWLTGIISEFKNHNDNGGNWEGCSHIAPTWTEENILTQIGAASRLSPGKSEPSTAAWVMQQKLIIDQLRWRTQQIKPDYYSAKFTRFYRTSGGPYYTWADTVLGWNGSAWVAHVSDDEAYNRGSRSNDLDPMQPDYFGCRSEKVHYECSGIGPFPIAHALDAYLSITASVWGCPPVATDIVFDNPDYPVADACGDFLLFQSNTTPAVTHSLDFWVGDVDAMLISEPSVIPPWGYGFRGWHCLIWPIVVRKYDVVGGFVFQ